VTTISSRPPDASADCANAGALKANNRKDEEKTIENERTMARSRQQCDMTTPPRVTVRTSSQEKISRKALLRNLSVAHETCSM
jgi:hypothetical protein